MASRRNGGKSFDDVDLIQSSFLVGTSANERGSLEVGMLRDSPEPEWPDVSL